MPEKNENEMLDREALITYLAAALPILKEGDRARVMSSQQMDMVKKSNPTMESVTSTLNTNLTEFQKHVVNKINDPNLSFPITEDKVPGLVDFFKSLTKEISETIEDQKIWSNMNISEKEKGELKKDIINSFAYMALFNTRAQQFGDVEKIDQNNKCSYLLKIHKAILENSQKPPKEIINEIVKERLADSRNPLTQGINSLSNALDFKTPEQRSNEIQNALKVIKGTSWDENKPKTTEYHYLGAYAEKELKDTANDLKQKISNAPISKKEKAQLTKLLETEISKLNQTSKALTPNDTSKPSSTAQFFKKLNYINNTKKEPEKVIHTTPVSASTVKSNSDQNIKTPQFETKTLRQRSNAFSQPENIQTKSEATPSRSRSNAFSEKNENKPFPRPK